MKAIISHDIDHLSVWEHKYDLIIPKFLTQSIIELFTGNIKLKEYFIKCSVLLRNKWQNIEEIINFDRNNNVYSTFFIGVANGLGLSYSLDNAEYWINKIVDNGFDIGVHGIEYSDLAKIKREFYLFKSIAPLERFGIRMHYLRNNENTINLLNDAGYSYDSTIYNREDCYQIGNLWEFPLHMMDGCLIRGRKKWQSQSLQVIKDETKIIIDDIYNKEIKYLTILFHDRYFSDGYKTWKDWYMWLIGYLINNRIEFINYKNAVIEMEQSLK